MDSKKVRVKEAEHRMAAARAWGRGWSPRRGKVGDPRQLRSRAPSNTVPTVNNTVPHTYSFGKRVDLTCSHHN